VASSVVDVSALPPQAYLGPLGTTGLTAYAALTQAAFLGVLNGTNTGKMLVRLAAGA
jgi:hypothetical protein